MHEADRVGVDVFLIRKRSALITFELYRRSGRWRGRVTDPVGIPSNISAASRARDASRHPTNCHQPQTVALPPNPRPLNAYQILQAIIPLPRHARVLICFDMLARPGDFECRYCGTLGPRRSLCGNLRVQVGV